MRQPQDSHQWGPRTVPQRTHIPHTLIHEYDLMGYVNPVILISLVVYITSIV